MIELDLVTFNLKKLSARPGARRILRELAAEPFDLAALQEVPRGGWGLLSAHRRAEAALSRSGQGRSGARVRGFRHGASGVPGLYQDGLSSFCRGPSAVFRHTEAATLRWYRRSPRAAFLERRVAQYSLLDLSPPEGPPRPRELGLVNVHLTHRRCGGRRSEVEALLAWLERLGRCPRRRARFEVLVGDFNCGPGDAEYERLTAAGFEDAWRLANGGAAGFTFDPGPGGNTEVRRRRRGGARRIDHVFVRAADGRPAAEAGLEVRRAALVFTEPVVTRRGRFHISDHYGVAVRLALR